MTTGRRTKSLSILEKSTIFRKFMRTIVNPLVTIFKPHLGDKVSKTMGSSVRHTSLTYISRKRLRNEML